MCYRQSTIIPNDFHLPDVVGLSVIGAGVDGAGVVGAMGVHTKKRHAKRYGLLICQVLRKVDDIQVRRSDQLCRSGRIYFTSAERVFERICVSLPQVLLLWW